jgi:elongin-A
LSISPIFIISNVVLHISTKFCHLIAIMPARSLYEQAKTATIRHIDLLTDVGYLPYSFMRPVLLKIENPEQLRALEKTCPQLLGEDGEVWLKLIKRDIANWEKRPHEPKNPELWWKVYKKLKREVDQEAKEAEEVLRQRMSDLQAQRTANTITAPTMMMPETTGRPVHRGPKNFSRTADKSTLRFTAGSKTKNVMDRARRETAEAKLRRQGPLTTATHLLATSRVRQAPQSMIDARVTEAATRPQGFKLSRDATASIGRALPKPQPQQSGLADREARLKALQSGNAPTSMAAHTSLAPGTNYRVPALGRAAAPMARTASTLARTGSPAGVKRKREADMFMQRKR